MKKKYTLHHFEDTCVRCKTDAERYFMHHNVDMETYFGIYGYCEYCLSKTLIGKRGPEDIEIFKHELYSWEEYIDVHNIIIA